MSGHIARDGMGQPLSVRSSLKIFIIVYNVILSFLIRALAIGRAFVSYLRADVDVALTF